MLKVTYFTPLSSDAMCMLYFPSDRGERLMIHSVYDLSNYSTIFRSSPGQSTSVKSSNWTFPELFDVGIPMTPDFLLTVLDVWLSMFKVLARYSWNFFHNSNDFVNSFTYMDNNFHNNFFWEIAVNCSCLSINVNPWLHQIMAQLLSEAIKHAPKHTINWNWFHCIYWQCAVHMYIFILLFRGHNSEVTKPHWLNHPMYTSGCAVWNKFLGEIPWTKAIEGWRKIFWMEWASPSHLKLTVRQCSFCTIIVGQRAAEFLAPHLIKVSWKFLTPCCNHHVIPYQL